MTQELHGKVFIAMCARGQISPLTLGALMIMDKPQYTWHWGQEMPLDVARNKAVLEFLMLGEDYTHLLFIDHDMVPQRDSLWTLWEANKEVVSGLYYRRLWPFMPHAYLYNPRKEDWDYMINLPKNTLIEVDGTGLGWILIRKDVFQRMDPPWFQFSSTLYKGAQGEDYYFFTKLRKLGIKTWLHTGVQLGHISQDEAIESRHFEATEALKKAKPLSF